MKDYIIVDDDTQEPRINVEEIISRMRHSAGHMLRLEAIQQHGKKANPVLKYQDKAAQSVVYEFNALSELVVFACIEVRVKYRDILIERRDEAVRQNQIKAQVLAKR